MKISLSRLALIAWLAWLLTLVMMVWLSFSRMLHPSFLYMAIPLVVQLLCTVAVFGGGIWRIFRGPRRGRAAFWIWLGLMPTLWMAAYINYLFVFASGRDHPPNVLTNMASPVSSLIGEPYVRLFFPHRYEGERFVMWSDSPTQDDKQMTAMDAHIRDMEKSLGAKTNDKVYWVRGPVYGISGRYVCGWSLGQQSVMPPDDADGLNYMDRHEVAHFVLDQLLPRPDYVPMLLQEGWAEVNSGAREVENNRRSCCTMLHSWHFLSLRELTSPAWYYKSEGPVYPQGGALVDYLLKRFGYQKFLELCRSCRPDTFPDDVQRVLGVSLDELDDDYQEDLAKQEKPELSDKEYLLSMKLGEKVSPEKWRQFVDDYCAAERLRAAYRQSSVKVTTTENVFDDAGKEVTTITLSQYDSDGQRHACTSSMTTNGIANDNWLQVVTPELEYKLTPNSAEKSWQLLEYNARRGRKRFSHPLENIDRREYLRMPLLPLVGRNGSYFETKILEIEADSPLVRIQFENSIKTSGIVLSHGWWDLDPQRDYVLVEEQFENLNAQGTQDSDHLTFQYETIAGNQVLKTARSEYQLPNRKPQTRTIKLDSCQFGPPPTKIFELSTYGNFNPIANNPLLKLPPTTHIGILTWIASCWTVIGLITIFSWILIKHFAKSRKATSNSVVGKTC